MIAFEIDAGFLQKILEATSVIADEPTIVFEEVGMSIVCQDGPKVCLVQLGLRKSEFDAYDIEEKQKISFDVSTVASYLVGASGTVMFEVVKNKISLMLPSKYGFKTFEVPLLAETGETRVPTKMEFDSRCKVDLDGLQSVVRDAERVKAEFCKFLVSGEGIEVVIEGEKGSAKNVLELGKGIISAQLTEESRFVTTLLMLKDILRVGSAFTNIALFEFSERLYPCRLTFQIPFDGKLILLVAPVDDSAVGK